MFSLEKMLQYLDEFIHLKEEEKNNNQLNILIEPLVIKINILEKEIKNLQKEKEENKKQISELNNKIINLEKKIENYNYNEMQDIIYSLSDKEKKLNLLINDFSDITKESNIMIDNKMNEKINEINIFNENRINELLVLIHDINKIIEENEIKINKFNENVEKIQKDNISIIKYISVQEQKFNRFELIINEINNLKEKFFLLNDFNYNNKIEDNMNKNLLK
jgi:chromosome segregation ATPase